MREIIIFFSLSIMCFIAVLSYGKDNSVPRDAYVSAITSDIRNFISFYADDSSSAGISSLIYDGLTKIDKNFNIIGSLAEKWDIEKDGLEIIFYLRKNVKWHDGVQFTARDVYFTYMTILNPETASPYISEFNLIDKIEIIDDYTVRFKYKEPFAPSLIKLGMGIIPEHIFKNDKNIKQEFSFSKIIGTGPYKIEQYEDSQFIIFKANNDYFDGAPGIKYYVVKILPDQSTMFLEMVSGNIDSSSLSPYQFRYRTASRDFLDEFDKYEYLAPSYTYIGYNLTNPVFMDKRVRLALNMAINREELIKFVLLGYGESCSGPFIKNSIYYNQEVAPSPYDLDKAKELLNSAGWRDSDNDGILEKDGKKFSITLLTNQGSELRENTATIIQKYWRIVGVDLKINIIAWPAFIEQFINKKNFEVVLLGWQLAVDPDPYAVWHSDAIKNGLNFISYSNKEVDMLIEQGRRTFDINKRVEIYRKIHEKIAEDAPYGFLFFEETLTALNKRFKGVEPSPAGIAHNFLKWAVPDKEVKYKI
ncbi:oligopeptide-binding protein AppA [Candidatus Omnitrophus magneticus]|uniref:Oligopeptide-binding protein AppA n=1 Tax=Candidatus Omnitrophus magneticus TaxID=1609969 RepID=A0A0F0CNP4_9BACT|nr:oligopeptide-binding protein AppA [Candidatus Omnitrophus magneticus]